MNCFTGCLSDDEPKKWRKARKKPVVVEFREVQKKTLIRVKYPEKVEVWGEIIETLEGNHEAHVGKDFIIKGVHGELYPIKKEIFEKTYEIIEESVCGERKQTP